MPRLIVSFGAKNGMPKPGDDGPGSIQIVDVRDWLKHNPYHDRTLRHLRGTDKAVQQDIAKHPDFGEAVNYFRTLAANSNANVLYFGCTGGHHRSVYVAEIVGAWLGLPVKHRDIKR